MSLQATLAFRELWQRPGRTALVLGALVLGVWGMGTPLLAARVLNHDLNQNFLRTRPPHLVLTGDFTAFDARAFPEIEAATLRDFALERVEIAPDRWLPVHLFGVDDFAATQLATLLPQRGAKAPPPGTVLVERDVLQIASFDVGDAPRLRVGGAVRAMPISGITFDASQAPATQDAFVYAYADRATWEALTGEKSGRRLLVRLRGVFSEEDVRRLSGPLVEQLRRSGVVVSTTNVSRFEQHPHQWQLNTLLFLVSAIGALAFTMAAVVVSQMMRALLEGQVKQTGVLKAIGATRGQVLRIAFLTSLSMGAIAGVLGVPLAAVSGWRFARFVAKILNFDILTPAVPYQMVLLLVALSLVLPVLFALPALIRASGVSVLQALRETGVRVFGRKEVRSLRWLSPVWRLALRNVRRDRTRLAVTVLSMALGVAIFETGFNVRASLWQFLSRISTENGQDVTVVLDGAVDRTRALALFAGVPNVARVETWSGGRGELQSRVLSTQQGVGIVALPRESTLLRLSLTQGRWLAPSRDLEVVLNQAAWLAYGRPVIGAPIDLAVGTQRESATVVGIAQQFDKAKLFIDQGDYDARFNPGQQINTLLFVASDRRYEEVLDLKRALERVVAGSDLRVLEVMSHAERVRIVYAHLDIILVTLLLLSLLVLVVSAIGNAAAAGVEVLRRARELGVMRAIGATPQQIARLLRREGVIMSLLGIALGLVLAVPSTVVGARFFGELMLGDGMRLEPAWSGPGLVTTIVVTIVFGFLASWLPARSIGLTAEPSTARSTGARS